MANTGYRFETTVYKTVKQIVIFGITIAAALTFKVDPHTFGIIGGAIVNGILNYLKHRQD